MFVPEKRVEGSSLELMFILFQERESVPNLIVLLF
jgi:hypothetical protein